MVTGVRLYIDGHKWYIQDLLLGNIIGRYNKKSSAMDFICRNNLSLGA